MTPGKRYQVFSIIPEKGERPSRWVKSGSAFMNRDGSVNVYLDVLPIDGTLHVREPLKDEDAKPDVCNCGTCPVHK